MVPCWGLGARCETSWKAALGLGQCLVARSQGASQQFSSPLLPTRRKEHVWATCGGWTGCLCFPGPHGKAVGIQALATDCSKVLTGQMGSWGEDLIPLFPGEVDQAPGWSLPSLRQGRAGVPFSLASEYAELYPVTMGSQGAAAG
jgi:hypothetical protein